MSAPADDRGMKRARRAKDVEALLREIKRYRAVIDVTRSVGRTGGQAGPRKQKEEG